MKLPRKLEPIHVWTERIDDAGTIAVSAELRKVAGDKVYAFSTFVILDREQLRQQWSWSWRRAGEHYFHERLQQRVAQYGHYLPYIGDAEHFA